MEPSVRKTNAARWALWARVALVSYWVSLFVATHWPKPPQIHVVGGDKTLHCVAFAGLAILWALAIALTREPRRVDWLRVLLVLSVYAAIDELLQGPVGRSPEVGDWLADIAGTATGLMAFAFLLPQLRRWGLPMRGDDAARGADHSRHR